jgi:uncharacterized membrane protein YwzB
MNYWMIVVGIVIVVLGIIVWWGFTGASNTKELKDNCKGVIWFLLVIVMPIVIGTVVCAFGFTLILNGVS